MHKINKSFILILVIWSANIISSIENIRAEYALAKPKAYRIANTVTVNEKNNPTLYNLVKELALQMNVAIPPIYIYKGNFINNRVLEFFGDHLKSRVKMNYEHNLEIGEDAINQFSYEQLKALIVRQLAHLKFNHRFKDLGTFTVLYFSLAAIFRVLEKFDKDQKLNGVVRKPDMVVMIPILLAPQLILNKLRQKFEQESDIESLEITKDKQALISALIKNEELIKEKNKRRFWTKLKELTDCRLTDLLSKVISYFSPGKTLAERVKFIEEKALNS